MYGMVREVMWTRTMQMFTGICFKYVDAKCMDDNMEALADQVDVIFTATPQGFCASMMNDAILSKAKIIDLSADYRIKDVAVYEMVWD